MRTALEAIWRASVASLSGETLAARALGPLGRTLRPGRGGRLLVLALGKAAPAMARGARLALGEVDRALVVGAEDDLAPPGWRSLVGEHPVPGAASVAAGEALLAAAGGRTSEDIALVLLSGGGSSMAVAPAEGLEPDDKFVAHRALVRSGAPIEEINAVRKHLSRLKGGLLARALFPARVMVLAISDVGGGGLATVASGPCSVDPTTFADALSVVRERGLAERFPLRALQRLELGARGEVPETAKEGDPAFARLESECLAGPEDLARAAVAAARARGLTVESRRGLWRGDAGALAAELAAWALKPGTGPRLLVVVGEPTLEVRGAGSGGRAQHVALAVARALDGRPFTLLAAGSDGRDGPTEHAGAVVHGRTAVEARAHGIDLAEALASCDSAPVHARLGTALPRSAPVTNLTDLYLLGTP